MALVVIPITFTEQMENGEFEVTGIPCDGSCLVDALPEDAQIFTAHLAGEDMLMLTDAKGRYLICNPDGGLLLTEEKGEGSQSLWQLIPAIGGYHLKPAGAEKNLQLHYFGGKISNHSPEPAGMYLFNFYEVSEDLGEGQR